MSGLFCIVNFLEVNKKDFLSFINFEPRQTEIK